LKRSWAIAWDTVNNLKDFKIKLNEAEAQGKKYSVAIIDMNLSPENAKVRRSGQEAIKIIKSNHAYIGCIMASGSLSGDIVLKLRDDYDLDTYISKANITAESLEGANSEGAATGKITGGDQAKAHT